MDSTGKVNINLFSLTIKRLNNPEFPKYASFTERRTDYVSNGSFKIINLRQINNKKLYHRFMAIFYE
jgi:hypothetical protein